MESSEARDILRSLANGVDPLTGEVFGSDSPLNHPTIIRAIFSVLSRVEELEKANEKTTRVRKPKRTAEDKRLLNVQEGRPANHGLGWSEDERLRVSKWFESGALVGDIARRIERTKGSVVGELVKQGKIRKDERHLYR